MGARFGSSTHGTNLLPLDARAVKHRAISCREKSVNWAWASQRAFDPPAEPCWSRFARVGGDDVERAITRLADDAVSLTLDQRLRIAALLAQPAQPEVTPDLGPAADAHRWRPSY
ncbi:hypothetical protein Ari01nite_83920 [Paractinoplanes rishiriensis]|uniref:Uncharacterized protein n=1 Tax=Paractinoplanes rishiriensis TaxID=1050105 RepID=A0A919N2M6_9ACTN|nr:hypothetical protein Ari01nite_83920 [Actinoplanes rishiriensis]